MENRPRKIIKNIALARLMSKIDINFLAREVLALKRRRLGLVEEDGTLLSVTSAAGYRASNNSTRRSTLSAGLNVPRSPFYSVMDSDISRVRDDQQSSLTDAAFALIRELRSRGGRCEERCGGARGLEGTAERYGGEKIMIV